MTDQTVKLPLFPLTSGVNPQGCLVLGGCSVADLVEEYGTPLYVYDETTLREKAREFRRAFCDRYPTAVNYSCKAFTNTSVLSLFAEEGLFLDVVSGGEIGYAVASGFPSDRIDFPGNNKSAEELVLAVETGVRHVVVDNFYELEMLGKICGTLGKQQDILLRLSPAVEPETHRYIITGNVDSKFGIPLAQAEEAVRQAMAMPEVNLTGLHFHLGSQLWAIEPYLEALDVFLDLAADLKQKVGFDLKELSVGGGYAHRYLMSEAVMPVMDYADAIINRLQEKLRELDMEPPALIVEPGRSMVAGAGVAIYRAGVIKDIPGIRRYVSVDGGMCDNIQPALYQMEYEAVVANRMFEENAREVRITGKYCESGDILIRNIALPEIQSGDLIALPGCGAYNITQSANYNAAFRPCIVMVKDGASRVIRRRETLEDLIRCDT